MLRRSSSFDNGSPDPNQAYVAALIRNPVEPDNRSINTGFPG
ncbi:MAG: hypothetical protein ACO1TE_14340 [Prosthecobacter sp.]